MSTQIDSRLCDLTVADLNAEWSRALDHLNLALQSKAPSYGHRIELSELESEFSRRGLEPTIEEEPDITW